MSLVRLLLAASLAAPSSAVAQTTSRRAKAPEQARAAEAAASASSADPSVPAASSPAPASGAAPSSAATPPAAAGLLPMSPTAPSEERVQLDKITTVNSIKQQEYQSRVRPLTEQRDELALKNAIQAEKIRSELAPMEFEQRKLQIKGQMDDERNVQAIAALRYSRDKQRLENDNAREKLNARQIELDAEKQRLDAKKLERDALVADMDFQSRKLRMESELADSKTVALKADLELRDKSESWKKQANKEPDYLVEPFKDGVLTISDRRIPLDGPIVYGTADFVTERIHYFNNKSEKYPIFIVIDRSPGGSVMEGYRILKAMQASKAPVHVVVKSYAASMAATIATLAPVSYAYPNAIILHHQIWSVLAGNPTQQKQQLDVLKEWDRRLREPIAKKMGTSLKKFTDEMYVKNVDGDWEEFADEAQKLRWVDRIVHEIKETGIVKEPDTRLEDKPRLAMGLAEESDAKGDRFVRLPHLQNADAYFISNRDGYYR